MDALLGLLHPGWRILIGLFVALAVIVAGWRLWLRGPSRMTSAMGVAILVMVGLFALTVLLR